MKKYIYHNFLFLLISTITIAQNDSSKATITPDITQPKKWYDSFSIRGYAQVRYNRLFETNENLGCEQCDRSIGKNGGFFLR